MRRLICLLTLILWGFTMTAQAQTARFVMVSEGVHMLPQYVMEMNGYKTEVIRMSDFNNVMLSMRGGHADISIVANIFQCIPAIVIANAPFYIAGVSITAFPGALHVKDPTVSLKDKKIAYAGPAPEQIFYLQGLFKSKDLTERTIQSVYINNTVARYNTLLSGHVDAAVLNPPYNFAAERQGYPSLGWLSDHGSALPWNYIVISKTFAQQNPGEVRNFIKQYNEAVAYIYDPANLPTIARLIVDKTKMTPSDVLSSLDVFLSKKWFGEAGTIQTEQITKPVEELKKFDVISTGLDMSTSLLPDLIVK